jgi:hypothetical protein
MVAAVLFISCTACIFGIFYLFFTTRNRERMAMIEKGVDPSVFTAVREPKTVKVRARGSGTRFALKSGMLMIGIGIGFAVSGFFPDNLDHDIYPLFVIGVILICGGAGLVTGFYLGRNLDKKDDKG